MEQSTLFGFLRIVLNARYTLKQNSDFRRLYSKGKSSVNPYLVVYCRKNGKDVNRTGYTVSAKLGHAVVRNRVRRRLREIYRLHSDSLSSGNDLVIVARSKCISAPYSKMEKAFENACQDLGLVK